jgi:photosystem II stability/assembly factor-like uncharacterized protein
MKTIKKYTMKTIFVIFIISQLIPIKLNAQVQISQISTVSLRAIKFMKDGTGFVVGDSGTMLITKDYGTTWNSLQVPTKVSLRSISIIDDSIICIVGGGFNSKIFEYEGVILRTIDKGSSWQSVSTLQYEMLNTVRFIDKSFGYAVGSARYPGFVYRGVIKKTTNGGLTWDSVYVKRNNPLYDVQILNHQTAYAVGGGISLKTQDSGASWVDQTAGPSVSWPTLYSVCFFNIDVGIELGQSDIIKTTNGGLTWSTIHNPFRTNGWWLINATYFNSYSEGIAITDIGELYRTTDSGDTWRINKPDISKPLYALDFLERNKGFSVGGDGVLLKFNIDNISFLTSVKTEKVIPDEYALNIYPNPFNNSTKIQFSVPKSDFIQIRISNLLGQEVGQLLSGFYEKGKYTVNYDASNLSSGTYVCTLYLTSKHISNKLILIK